MRYIKSHILLVSAGIVALASLAAYFLYAASAKEGQGVKHISMPLGSGSSERLRPSEPITKPRAEATSTQDVHSRGYSELTELAEIEKIRNPLQREKALIAFFKKWAAVDPVAAINRAEAFPVGVRQKYIDAVLSGWALKDPNAAWKWASNVASGLPAEEKDRYTRNTMQTILGALMEADRPGDAAALISDMPNGRDRLHFVGQLGTHWAETDSAGALAWLGTLTNRFDRLNALSGILTSISREDPVAATEYARSLSNPDDRGIAIAGVLQPLLESGDPKAALTWLKVGSHLPEYDHARMAAILNLGDKDPSIFTPLLDDMVDPKIKFNAAQEAVLISSRSNPAQAIQLAVKYYSAEQFDKAAPRLFSGWAKSSYQEAHDFAIAMSGLTEPQRQKILDSLAASRKPKP